jgi:1,4-dihydroxy-2-naphthoyl-CoA hydrolase
MTEAQDELAGRAAGTLEGTLGFELTEIGEELARGYFDVAERVRQPLGIVHGGAYAAYAESLASAATFRAVQPESIAMGQSNDTSFLRPISEGRVHVEARRRHRGRTTWVWEVEFTDDQGRLCAISRVTMAVRPTPQP